MNNKPFFSALGAYLYIIAIIVLVHYLMGSSTNDETWFVPVVMLSLLVLSVAVMAYLFLSESVRLYSDSKKEAIGAFLKTLCYFSGFVALSIIIYILAF